MMTVASASDMLSLDVITFERQQEVAFPTTKELAGMMRMISALERAHPEMDGIDRSQFSRVMEKVHRLPCGITGPTS